MGTIAQKLEYLNDTRLLLKDNINKINNVLDDNSTFRSYPQELFNGYLDILNNGTDTLWNNLEKVSATGEEATLENVETAPIKIMLNGNTIQDGTPTPDTPVEVKVVKGENVVSISGENQSDKTDYPINLGDIELCKINTYKDYFHKDSGKWYVHKEIGKKILNGSENWADRQQGSATYLYLKCTLQNGANGGISDKFKYNQSYNAPEEHILVSNEWNEASIVIRKDRLNTPNVANFKSWLSNNNVKLYYVLATPTEEEITNTTLIEQLEAISNAKSVKDKTYVTQTNDGLPFILDVSAIKEYEVN